MPPDGESDDDDVVEDLLAKLDAVNTMISEPNATQSVLALEPTPRPRPHPTSRPDSSESPDGHNRIKSLDDLADTIPSVQVDSCICVFFFLRFDTLS